MIPYNKDTAYKAAGLGATGTRVKDVTIDGASIVEEGVAVLPFAEADQYGVVKVGDGLTVEDGVLSTSASDIMATNAQSVQQNLERIDQRIDTEVQPKLTAGTGITISDQNVISASGGGGGTEYTFTKGLTEASGTVSTDLYDYFRWQKNATTNKNYLRCVIGGNYTTGEACLTRPTTNGPVIQVNDSRNMSDSTKMNNQGILIGDVTASGTWAICPPIKTTDLSLGYRSGSNRANDKPINSIYAKHSGTVSYSDINNDSDKGDTTFKKLVIAANAVGTAPTSDGNYVLKCTVTGGVPTYTWVAE